MISNNNYSDLELISMLKRGEERGFELLYARHWSAMYQAAFYLLREQEAAMDVVQDIFTWLWEKRGQLDIQAVPSYLRTATLQSLFPRYEKGPGKI